MSNSSALTEILRRQFRKQLDLLWPVLKGSLAQVYKPCIRPTCPLCLKGDKHPAFIFSFTQAGRRRCMYVPAELVPLFRRGLENGRKLEQMLYQTGPDLLLAHRQTKNKTSAPSTARSTSKRPRPILKKNKTNS